LDHDWTEISGRAGEKDLVCHTLSDTDFGRTQVLLSPVDSSSEKNWVGFVRHGSGRDEDCDYVLRSASALSDTPVRSEEIAAARYGSESLNAAVASAGLALWSYSFGTDMFHFESFFRDWFVGTGRPGWVPFAEVYDSIHPEDKSTFCENFEHMPEDADAKVAFVARVRHPKLGMRWVRFLGAPQLKTSSDPLSANRLAGTVQDVHEQVRLDRQIMEAVSDLAESKVRVSEVAHAIQTNLLVKPPPKRVGNFYIKSCSFPSHVADGDFLDVLPLGDGIVDLVVGDVMGKGIEAALVSAGLKAQVARSLSQLAVSGKRPEPKAVMQAVHDCIGGQLAKLDSFATMAYVRLHSQDQTLELVDCGHTRTLILSPESLSYRFVSSNNLPLGVITGEVYNSVKCNLAPGDIVVMYSDGLLDTVVDGERLDEEGIAKFALAACAGPSPVETIVAFVKNLHETQKVTDDLTCLVAEFRVGARRIVEATFDSDLEAIDPLRDFIGSAVAQVGPDVEERELAALEMAAVEAFTNVVRHAHKGRSGQTVTVALSRELNTHVLRLRYAGERFEPNLKQLPDVRMTLKESGWGLQLMNALAESIEYDQDDRGVMSVSITRPIGFKAK